MSSSEISLQTDLTASEPNRAPEEPRTNWQKFRLVVKFIELRLRFIALMAITGLIFAYWDTLWNRYEKWLRPAGEQQVALSRLEYYCPMHPHVVQEEPGSCPICGMPLTTRTKGDQTPLPAGATARVVLTSSRREQAGVRTVSVGYAPLTQTVETVGYVAFDERLVANVVSKVPGKSRVEKLHVNVTGQTVEAGQPLAELYSPELSQSVAELLIVSRRTEPGSQRPEDAAHTASNHWQAMVRAASEKLKRYGITDGQIAEILKNGKNDFKIPILSPVSGHVFKKNVVEGQEVPEGYPMFEVINLDTVWVQAQVYEHQLGLIHEGQDVVATVGAFPGKRFPGRLELMQPRLDPATRTVEVRYAVRNSNHQLRPGMFATVTLETPIADLPDSHDNPDASEPASAGVPLRRATLTPEQQKKCPVTTATLGSMGEPISVQVEGRKVWTCCGACLPKLKAHPARYLARLDPAPGGQILSVPESAVIDSGTRKIVYVETEPGVYEGREVTLGPRSGDRFVVLEGLAVGERVAAAGAFLIDAESRLNPVSTHSGTTSP